MSAANPAVFLSYASQDAEAARRIAEALRGFGVEVWFDRNELRGGDQWDNNIRSQIKACSLFIPVISATTQSRDEAYFRLEWKLADDRSHLMAPGKPFIVPVVIDDTPEYGAAVPDSFTKAQWTRLPDGEPTTAFIDQIKRLTAPKVVGASLDDARVPASANGRGQATPLPRPAKKRRWGVIAGGVVVAIAAIVLVLTIQDSDDASAKASATADASGKKGPATYSDDRPYFIGSIAVLPLKILPGAQAWQDEVDGLHEELLNQLSDMKPFDLASRTSVLQYREVAKNLRTIGEELDVDFLVEGSVQKVGDAPRLTLQVIEVATDRHVFSRNFDYPQDENQDPVVQQKSFAFGLALSIYRGLRDERPPTDEGAQRLAEVTAKLQEDAQERSTAFFNRLTTDGYRDLIERLAHFCQIDPDNAFARGHYALILSQKTNAGASNDYLDPGHVRELSLALEQALRVDPDDLIAQEQMGNLLVSRLDRPREGLPYLRKVVTDLDERIAAGEVVMNNWKHVSLAQALRNVGQAAAAIAVLERAPQPPAVDQIWQWQQTYLTARRPAEIIALHRSLKGQLQHPEVDSQKIDAYLDLSRTEVEVGWTGSADPALRLYEQFKGLPEFPPGYSIYLLRFTDRHQEMLQALAKLGAAFDPMEPYPDDATRYRITALRGLGNEALARSYLRSLLQAELPPDGPRAEVNWAAQAYYHAALGDQDAAEKAIATCRAAMDAQRNLSGYLQAQRIIAMAYAELGLPAEAAAALDAVLSSPGPFLTGHFMVESVLLPIRHTPEFEAVIRKHADQLKDPAILDAYFAKPKEETP